MTGVQTCALPIYDVTLARAGTITPQKYLDIVSQNLTRLLQNAGRFRSEERRVGKECRSRWSAYR